MVRRVEMSRYATSRWLVPLVVAGLAVGAGAATLAAPTTQVLPAEDGEATYLLTGLQIMRVAGAPSDEVEVSYEARWATDIAPGEARCQVEVLNASGVVVGAIQFGLRINSPGLTSVFRLIVSVDDAPSTARGYCSAGEHIDPGATYVFSELEVVVEPGPRVIGLVSWLDDKYPGEQFCRAELIADGLAEVIDFTLGIPEGRGVIVLLPDRLGAADVTSATCEPITATSGS